MLLMHAGAHMTIKHVIPLMFEEQAIIKSNRLLHDERHSAELRSDLSICSHALLDEVATVFMSE